MTPAEIAALKRLTAWNTGDKDAIPSAYTHDALTFQQDLRRILTLAEQALRLREAAQAVVDEIDNSSEWISLEPRVDALRAALIAAVEAG